jgi:hypothetical protein
MRRGTKRRPIASAIHPMRMYILPRPMVVSHGTREEGMPMLTALRRNATPMKASAVSYTSDGKIVSFSLAPANHIESSHGKTYLSVCVDHKCKRNIGYSTQTEGKQGATDAGVDPVHALWVLKLASGLPLWGASEY